MDVVPAGSKPYICDNSFVEYMIRRHGLHYRLC